MGASQKLTRIGVFYDGNFFRHVSNYYAYTHPRQARLSISGLHDYIRHRVADDEGEDPRFCHVVDVHYFRGRMRAQDAEERNLLLAERTFDDVLMREGVTTHYLPMGAHGEKGIDVWLALEAFELAMYKRFDVLALVACDGDFVPLVRKLNTLGTRVMLLGWDFQVEDAHGAVRETRTSQLLLDEVTYPVLMHQVIDDRAPQREALITGMFVQSDQRVPRAAPMPRRDPEAAPVLDATGCHGTIQSLKEGYGFIKPMTGTTNLFFAYSVLSSPLSDLHVGSAVEYDLGHTERGPCGLNVRAA